MGDRTLAPVPFLIAGIVNITPDSFSDGGLHAKPEEAVSHARRLVEDGAHIIDLGAESTRPGAVEIGSIEEIRRLVPVLQETVRFRDTVMEKARQDSGPHCNNNPAQPTGSGTRAKDAQARDADNTTHRQSSFVVSVDTFRAHTAAMALSMGADIINDVSGGIFEPEMVEVIASYKPGYVLGHSPERPAVMQKAPHYENVVEELLRYFTKRMNILVKAGVPESRICLDPCIGFGKTVEHSLQIMASVDRFRVLGRPLFFGISRKAFISSITGYSREDRDMHTQVVTAYLARHGVRIHRVHNVRAAVATLTLSAMLESA